MRRSSLIYASALVLAVGIAGAMVAFFHTNRAGAPPHAVPGKTVAPAPHFRFDLKQVRPISTGKAKGTSDAAHAAARRIQKTLDELYLGGFLDPSTWGRGNYGDVWRLFTHDALPTAQHDEETLTLGPHAGSVYEAVEPHSGALAVRVLMDPAGHPSTAVAIVAFSARGTEQDGTSTAIRSTGQYFLSPGSHGWSIDGYQVTRDDGEPGKHAKKAAP